MEHGNARMGESGGSHENTKARREWPVECRESACRARRPTPNAQPPMPNPPMRRAGVSCKVDLVSGHCFAVARLFEICILKVDFSAHNVASGRATHRHEDPPAGPLSLDQAVWFILNLKIAPAIHNHPIDRAKHAPCDDLRVFESRGSPRRACSPALP